MTSKFHEQESDQRFAVYIDRRLYRETRDREQMEHLSKLAQCDHPGSTIQVKVYTANQKTSGRLDPMEHEIESALVDAGVEFTPASDSRNKNLDFYLLEASVHIEVKQAFSPRIAAQAARVDNLIVAQGPKAVAMLAAAIRATGAKT